MLTRYDLHDDGVLAIRRVVRLGTEYLRTSAQEPLVPVPWKRMLLQNWIPLRAGPEFGTIDLAFDEGGRPTHTYSWGTDVPTQGEPVGATNGYAVLTGIAGQGGTFVGGTFVAVIFGTQPAKSADWQFRMRTFKFAQYNIQLLSPELILRGPPAGTVVDFTIDIWPGTQLSRLVTQKLRTLATSVSAPSVYKPDTALSDELAIIVGRLKKITNLQLTPAMRLDHLGAIAQ